MGFYSSFDGGNPLRVAIEYEGPTHFDLPDKKCRIKGRSPRWLSTGDPRLQGGY